MRSGARTFILATVLLAGCGSSTASTSVPAAPIATTTTSVATVGEPKAEEVDVANKAAAAPVLPVTVLDHVGNEVTIAAVDRIIPLDGTVAEVVFALGLGANVVATDLSATYPPEADALPEIGYQRSLTAESIARFAPTVLLATEIAGRDDLRRLGYPLVIVPNEASPEGPAAKIRASLRRLVFPSAARRWPSSWRRPSPPIVWNPLTTRPS